MLLVDSAYWSYIFPTRMEPRQRLWSVHFTDVFPVPRLSSKLLRKEEEREERKERLEGGGEKEGRTPILLEALNITTKVITAKAT